MGATVRDHLIDKVRKGSKDAARELEGPEYPETIEYLREMFYQLYGRSGMGADGVAPLSYGTIRDWSQLTGRAVTPMEVYALLRLDLVMRSEG